MARKNLLNALFMVVVIILSSCSDKYEFMEGVADPNAVPSYYEPINKDKVTVYDENGNIIETNVSHIININAEEKKVHGGTSPLELKTSQIDVVDDGTYAVKYMVEDVEDSYNLTIEGYVMKYKEYELTPKGAIKISIDEYSNDIQEKPFLQNFVSSNGLTYGDITLGMAKQEIEVSEGEAYLKEIALLGSEHVLFEDSAEITSNPTHNQKTLVVKGVNQASFKEYWSNDSTAIAVIEYNLEYHFNITAPAEVVINGNDVIGKSFEVKNGKVNISGYDFEFTYSSTNCDTVEYKGTDYTDKVLKCNPEVKTVKVIDANTMEIYVYENNIEDYAKASMLLTFTEPEAEFEKTIWEYEHTEFVRNATVAGTNITVVCNNVANFVDIYSDGTEQNEEAVSYQVNNVFKVSGLSFEVANLNNVIGKTYNIVNGVVTIEGNSVVVEHVSSSVKGSVMHNNTNYASQIHACTADAKTINFNSQSEAVIRFYNDNSNDYAEATVQATITEQVTVTAIEKTYTHVSFNSSTVNGKIISIACDNIASFVKVYSNHTSDPVVEVPYTWNNYFQISVPEFYTHNMNEKTYYFNAGSANVEGQDVSVTFSSREVSDIYFDGKNYKDEAPICYIQPECITFREGFADITFRGGEETVIVTITISYRTAETLDGKIVAGWLTDSFKNQHQNYEGTYLHIMAEINGAYVIYSKRNDASSWTTTSLTATEGANLLSSGRAAAWVFNGYNYVMGSVTAIEREDVNDRWILEYYLLNGQLAYRLGTQAEAIMGGVYRHPIREVATNTNGIWLINNQVFAGTIN